MLKNKIYKYFSIEIIKSFLTILFAFTAIAWTVRAVNFLDLVVENGHSVKTYFLFSLLNMTNILTKFIPLSFLLALMMSILKFQRQNELIILWSAGLNKIKLVNLFFLLSLITLLIQLCFSSFVTPNALNKSRQLIRSSDLDSISFIIKANDFSDSFKNVTFFVEKRNSQNEMENIFIRDETNAFKNLVNNEENFSNTTIIAEKGLIDNENLILMNGLIQSQNKLGELSNVNFSKTVLKVASLVPRTITTPKLQETPTSSLMKCLLIIKDKNFNKELSNCPESDLKKDVIETMSRRIGMPIYIPVVTLISCFLLVSKRSSKYKFFSKYIYFFISFLILVLAEVLVRYSGFSDTNTIAYFSIPIILIPLVYIFLIKKFQFEKVKR